MLLLLPVARGDTGNGLRVASDSPDTHRSDLVDTLSSWQVAFDRRPAALESPRVARLV